MTTAKFACLCFAAGYLAAVFIGFWPVFYALIILAILWAVFKAPIRRTAVEHRQRSSKKTTFEVGPDGLADKPRKAWWQ